MASFQILLGGGAAAPHLNLRFFRALGAKFFLLFYRKNSPVNSIFYRGEPFKFNNINDIFSIVEHNILAKFNIF